MHHKQKRNSFWRNLLLGTVIAGFVLLGFFVLPYTALYKIAVRSLFFHNHQALAYYFNYADADLALRLGDCYFSTGSYNLERAENSYQLAASLDPHLSWDHHQLARIYFVEGKFSVALQEINTELVLRPDNLRALYVRGLIKLAQYDFEGAEADFTRFVAWAPTEWGGYNDLAFTLAKEAKYAESEKIVQKAIAQVPGAPTNPWLFNSLGLAQLNQLRYKDATISFSKALELSKSLNVIQWQHAYSANDPEAAEASLFAFQQSIEKNLAAAKRGATLGE